MWYIHDVPIFVFVFSVAMRAVDFRYFVVVVVVFRHSRQFQILLEFLRRFGDEAPDAFYHRFTFLRELSLAAALSVLLFRRHRRFGLCRVVDVS